MEWLALAEPVEANASRETITTDKIAQHLVDGSINKADAKAQRRKGGVLIARLCAFAL